MRQSCTIAWKRPPYEPPRKLTCVSLEREFLYIDELEKVRLRAESFADHYSHARLFFRSQSDVEQAHIADAIIFELSKVKLEHVRLRVLANLINVDHNLAARIAEGLNIVLPERFMPAVEPIDMEISPALRLIDKYPPTLKGRSVGILVSDGADGSIIKSVRAAIEGAGASVTIIAPKIGGVTLKDGTILQADGQLAGTPSVLFDAIGLIVSKNGCAELLKSAAATDFVHNAFGHLKAIGFTEEALPLLDKAGINQDNGAVKFSSKNSVFVDAASVRQWTRKA